MTKKLRKGAVAERYGDVDVRTVDRWLADPALKFPRPIFINRIPYWDESDLTKWERTRATSKQREDAA
jgi:predicted DNA-binding transcriptional regulator AlpA